MTGAKLSVSFLILGLAFGSCSYQNPMSEYGGVDFLETHDLTEWTATSGGTMTFAAVAVAEAGDFAGLPGAGADAHRLAVDNLAANGDFEAGIPGGWTAGGSSSATLDTGGEISGNNSMVYDTGANTSVISYDFSASAVTNGVYRVFFSIKKQATSPDAWYLQLRSGSTIVAVESGDDRSFADADSYSDLTSEIVIESGAGYFEIGNDGGKAQRQWGFIDDVRIARFDLDQSIIFDVPYQETGGLPLVSGAYTFSVWVKAETAAQLTPNIANRYPATAIAMGIDDDIADTTTGKTAQIFTSIGSTWTKISITKDNTVVAEQDPPTTDPVLRLCISPQTVFGDDNGASVPLGSLLIAEPSLVLSD